MLMPLPAFDQHIDAGAKGFFARPIKEFGLDQRSS